MVRSDGGVAVSADDVQHVTYLLELHVRALELHVNGSGQGGERGAPHPLRLRVYHIGHGIVVGSKEGSEGLALMQAIRSSADQQPFASCWPQAKACRPGMFGMVISCNTMFRVPRS